MSLDVATADEVRGTVWIACVCERLLLASRLHTLDGEELARWLDLDERLRSPVDDPRASLRVRVGLTARVSLPATGEEAPARIVDVSAGGAFVETSLDARRGARLLVRVGPGRAGYEWRLPAEVVRDERERGPGVAVRWSGAPLVLRHHGTRDVASSASGGGR